MWLGKLTALDIIPLGDLAVKSQHKQTKLQIKKKRQKKTKKQKKQQQQRNEQTTRLSVITVASGEFSSQAKGGFESYVISELPDHP